MFRYLFLFIVLLSANSYAAQDAYVKTTRAIIYADKELKSPLGYIRRGKKLRVGDIKRKQGTVLPVIISGRVAYIEVKNIALPQSKSLKEKGHTTHLVEEKRSLEEIWLSDSHFRVDLSFVDPGPEWGELVAGFGNSKSLMFVIPVMWELRPLDWNWTFDIGMSVGTLNAQDISMLTLGGEFWAQYSLIRTKFLALDLRGGYLFSPGGVKIRYSYTEETNNGSYWGFIAGAQLRLFRGKAWELNVGVDYRQMVLLNLDKIVAPNSGVYQLNNIRGVSAFIGTNIDL